MEPPPSRDSQDPGLCAGVYRGNFFLSPSRIEISKTRILMKEKRDLIV